jgi:hypothetical protein
MHHMARCSAAYVQLAEVKALCTQRAVSCVGRNALLVDGMPVSAHTMPLAVQ